LLYKFDQFGDWKVNWGDENGDFRGDLHGRLTRTQPGQGQRTLSAT
jgi:hypothetical protein